MKRISGVRRITHKVVLNAVKDYYGQYDRSIKSVVSSLVGKNISLTDSEKSDVWAIKNNLEDDVYIKNLMGKDFKSIKLTQVA